MSPLSALPPVSSLASSPAVSPTSSPATPAGRPARSPEAAARQFESVLVRQFVEVMTRDLFKAGAEGEMLTGQADLQRDTLTNVLTEHLVDSGTFGVADLMMRQWSRAGQVPADASADAPATAPVAPSGTPATPDGPPSDAFFDASSGAPPAFDPRPDLS